MIDLVFFFIALPFVEPFFSRFLIVAVMSSPSSSADSLLLFHRAVLLGSGSSASTPSLACLMSSTPCATCLDAVENPNGPNCRHNPSLLLQFSHRDQPGEISSVVIDCGKTFRQSALRSFRSFGVRYLKGVLLTHAHADAFLGLDDLREFNDPHAENGIGVYADERTMDCCRDTFGYLFPKPPVSGAVQRWTASIQWHAIHAGQLQFVPIHPTKVGDASAASTSYFGFVAVPVLHGADYLSNAFVLCMGDVSSLSVSPSSAPEAIRKAAVAAQFLVYISDVHLLTEEAYQLFEEAKRRLLFYSNRCGDPSNESGKAESMPVGEVSATELLPTAVLVVDMLNFQDKRSTHFDVPRSIEATKRIQADKTYYVGMSHCLSYKTVEEVIEKAGLKGKAFTGYDGCVIAEHVTR